MDAALRWFVMDKLDGRKDMNNVYSNALSFYSKQLSGYKGRILEVGLRKAILQPSLTGNGLQVEGMVIAKQVFEENTTAEPFLLKPSYLYDAIFIPFGQFLAIPERVMAIKALKSCYDHIKPNGRIIIDLILQEEHSHSNPKKSEIKYDKDNLLVFESQMIDVDYYEQKATYFLTYEQWTAGECLQRERRLQTFLWFGVKEFKLVLEKIGFTNVAISGDYQQANGQNGRSYHKVYTFEATKGK
ncbi:hypothetical protein WQ54_10350 [Bacillus sp. SA1-12]|uniref:SAM-dependent methyltransferase n=1 Tax=Bacillus sp. SA1-12 TaxID=1455638 RepID=UPI0006251A0C|nr:SAM-dependent methyltransferase [Bacillus sp. SA1-12]KKI92216.1 hypothetical protein WQ54_10350 [Bacillus sp. SA1-12]